MDKYVCNFGAVREQCNNLKNCADDLENAISDYESKINDNLSGWTGAAKDSFIQSLDSQIQRGKRLANKLREYVSSLEEAVKAIETVEEEMGSQDIK